MCMAVALVLGVMLCWIPCHVAGYFAPLTYSQRQHVLMDIISAPRVLQPDGVTLNHVYVFAPSFKKANALYD